MGTNFYLRRKLSQEEKQHIIDNVNNSNWEEVRECLPEDIHIGKRSGGWKFLWDAHYFKYYEPTKPALMEWLKSGEIIDEYGQKFTFDQFINDELDGFLEEGWDIESYYEDHPKEKYHWFDFASRINDFIRKCPDLKVPINKYGEFYIANLRFTVSEDFG